MVALMCAGALFLCLLAGIRYPGALIAGTFFTYQAGSISSFGWLGMAYVALAAAWSLFHYLRHPHRITFNVADYGLLGLTIFLFLSIFWSPYPDDSVQMSILLIESVAGMYLIGRLQKEDLPKLIHQIAVTSAILGVIMGIGLLKSRVTGQGYAETTRLLISNENASAVGLTQALPFSMYASVMLLFFSRSNWARLLALVSLPFVAYVSIIAATRSVFLSFVIATLFAILLGMREIPMRRYLMAISAVLSGVVVMLTILPESQKIVSFDRLLGNWGSHGILIDSSGMERLYLYKAAENLFMNHPIIGASYGVFGRYSFFDYPHNMFLEIASAAGSIGLALSFLWMSGVVLNILIIRRRDVKTAAILFGYFCIGLVQLQVSYPFFVARPLFLLTAVIAGYAAAALVKRGRRRTRLRHPLAPGVEVAIKFPPARGASA